MRNLTATIICTLAIYCCLNVYQAQAATKKIEPRKEAILNKSWDWFKSLADTPYDTKQETCGENKYYRRDVFLAPPPIKRRLQ